MKEKVVIGKVFGVHGIKGDLKIYPITDDKKRFTSLETCLINNIEYNINSVRLHKDIVILKLEGINNRNDAELCKNKYVEIKRTQAIKLKANEFFIEDLKGLEAFDSDGNNVGHMIDVLTNASVDIYVFKNKNTGKEFMLTAMKENILDISLDNNKIIINLKNKVESN